jgi:hypothetical protein
LKVEAIVRRHNRPTLTIDIVDDEGQCTHYENETMVSRRRKHSTFD